MKRLIHSSIAFVTAIACYSSSNLIAQQVEPFTYRAPLDPYSILQLPEFMVHSRARTDFIIQRSVFKPGVGGWHIHPGPSFALVIQGHIKLQKFTEKDGCFETPVYGPGQVYIKPPNELHRAVVVGEEDEVELIVRFNYPEGGPIGIPAADPGCPSENLVPAVAPLNQPPHTADALENFTAQQVEPFTFRATLDPYDIHQLPDFLMHSGVPSDIAIQRIVSTQGAGGWHIHPGPSFAYVIQGQTKLQIFNKKEGCFETQVYGPGQAYLKPANQVHRAIVLSQDAVEIVVRFNIPVGDRSASPPPTPAVTSRVLSSGGPVEGKIQFRILSLTWPSSARKKLGSWSRAHGTGDGHSERRPRAAYFIARTRTDGPRWRSCGRGSKSHSEPFALVCQSCLREWSVKETMHDHSNVTKRADGQLEKTIVRSSRSDDLL